MPHVVFVVQHVNETSDTAEDVKFIGVYSTRARADAAIARLNTQPGFRDTPEGFHIDEYDIDRDHWVEGFVTLVGDTEVPTRPTGRSRPAG